MRRYLTRFIIGLLLTVVFMLHVTGSIRIPFLQRVENIAYDARVVLTSPGGIDNRVVIVAIDEKSLSRMGHWPWTREKLAALMNNLFNEYSVAVAGFDMVFAERDTSETIESIVAMATESGYNVFANRLKEYADVVDRDTRFADSLASGLTIMGYFFETDPDKTYVIGDLPLPAFELHETLEGTNFLPTASGYGGNLPILMESAYSGGFISNPLIDGDGIVRRTPLLHVYKEGVYESLPLAVTTAFLGDIVIPNFVDQKNLIKGYPSLESLELGGEPLPIDRNGAVLVSYRGPAGSYPYISASDVIEGTVPDPELLDGAIVLVGATAAGLLDLRSTPFGSVYPGVEIHANVIASILDQSIRWRPPYTVAVELVIVAVTGILLSALIPLLSPIVASLVLWVFLLGAVGMNFYFWSQQSHVIPIASTLTLIIAAYVLNMFYGYFFESRSRAQMSEMFGQYIPPELVEEMSRDQKVVAVASQKKELSVLFCDVRDFTQLSESLEPDELSDLINDYLTPVTRIVHETKGTIDKYMGDAVMAFWGAPLDDPEHAAHAIEAALSVQASMDEINEGFKAHDWPPMKVGIGINTGPMSVGNMGSQFRRAYTVMGDAVNTASRLEGLTKLYQVPILVSSETVNKAPEYLYWEIDRVRVKGKKEATTIYRPVCALADADESLLAVDNGVTEMLAFYRMQEWDAAEKVIQSLVAQHDDVGFLSVYSERIQHFRESPPPTDWNGEWAFDFK